MGTAAVTAPKTTHARAHAHAHTHILASLAQVTFAQFTFAQGTRPPPPPASLPLELCPSGCAALRSAERVALWVAPWVAPWVAQLRGGQCAACRLQQRSTRTTNM